MEENKTTPDFDFEQFDATATPSLTLELEEEKPEEQPQQETAQPVVEEEAAKLSPEEQKVVDDFAEKIDITNSQMILQY